MELAFKKVMPLALPVIILNLFFLWNSQVLDYFTGSGVFAPHACAGSVCYHTNLAYILENGVNSIVGSVFVNPLMAAGPRVALIVGIDGVSIVCVAVLFVTLFRWYAPKGRGFALLRSLQLTDLVLMPLGLELLLDYVMNRSQENYQQLNEHVISMQGSVGVLSQFTNLDLVYVTVAVFVVATLLVKIESGFRYPGHLRRQALT